MPANNEPQDGNFIPSHGSGTEQLSEADALLRATLDATNDAILVTDLNHDVLAFNKHFLRLWNLPQEVIAAKNHDAILKFNSKFFTEPEAFIARAAAIHSGEDEAFDELLLKDGRIFERHSKIQTVNGAFVGRVWSVRDVTEARKLEEAQARLAAIVDSADDAIIGKTLTSVITSWNRGAERIFGYTAEEAIGKSIRMIIPPERQSEEDEILARLNSGNRIEHYKTERLRKDGTVVQLSLSISPIKDSTGRIIGASKIARDIAQQIEHEEEREALLDSERAARSEAERASQLKDEFLATLSHELRTPLNAILGWSQLLSLNPDAVELREGLDAIQRNARAQTQLIEDLLDMSRIISGKVRLDIQSTELVDVIDAAFEAVRLSAEAKGIRLRKILDFDAGPVLGDPTRLQQVVWNLLSNAIKFTPKGGSVDILLERVNSHLEITVHDSGVGIKPEFLPSVFERFRQADASTTRSYSGLGLGLSIVRHLVELHGGTVRAKSPGEGQGASFIVSLPMAPIRRGEKREHPKAPSPPTFDCQEVSLEGIKVLLVDDEPDARALISRLLMQCKAEVVACATADEGLEKVKTFKPDVVISDIGMPGKDGYQFIRELRQISQDFGQKLPAVALTAFARSEDRTRAMMAGYQVHLAKPIEPQELLATVGSLAGRTG